MNKCDRSLLLCGWLRKAASSSKKRSKGSKADGKVRKDQKMKKNKKEKKSKKSKKDKDKDLDSSDSEVSGLPKQLDMQLHLLVGHISFYLTE